MRMERIAPETRTVCQFTGVVATPADGLRLSARCVEVCDEADRSEAL